METVRSALDVLCICAVMPQAQLQLCERVDLPDEAMTVGLNVILGAAEGEIVQDPDVQRAALGVLITCVCAPVPRVSITQLTTVHLIHNQIQQTTVKQSK